MADYDGFNTRGWFETDDDHEEFEALMRHQKKLMQDWEERIGRHRGIGYAMLFGAPLVSLMSRIKDVTWSEPFIVAMLALAVYCFYRVIVLEKQKIYKAKEHSYQREHLLDVLVVLPSQRGEDVRKR